jgi:hypothetical protein
VQGPQWADSNRQALSGGLDAYPLPGPQFGDVKEPGSAEASYYTWVDQFDTFGLGKDVPIATGNMNDALLALVDGQFVVLRVPYPIGYFTKWMDGRIDDPNAGWKGKSLWSTYSTRTMFHLEGGKENRSKVVRFKLRPDSLARSTDSGGLARWVIITARLRWLFLLPLYGCALAVPSASSGDPMRQERRQSDMKT